MQQDLDNRVTGLNNGTRAVFKNRSRVTAAGNNPALARRSAFDYDFIDISCPDDQQKTEEEIIIGDPIGELDTEKTLLIRDLEVVQDLTRTFNPCNNGIGNPNGVWSFGYLMRQMASKDVSNIATDAEVAEFVWNWLKTWTAQQNVNGEDLPNRNNIKNEVINPWLLRSGVTQQVIDSQNENQLKDKLKMDEAPFRLTAIVNRIDLRGSEGFGATTNVGIDFTDSGEGRFVFCVMNPENLCNALEFNVIFEYGVNKTNCADVINYAQQWADLNNLTLGSTSFNQALENITRQFSDVGTNPIKPNQNSINQIRTNEFLNSPWELREFNLMNNGKLELVTVKMEPHKHFNGDNNANNTDIQMLVDFIDNHVPPIREGQYQIPDMFQGRNYLGSFSHTPFPPTGTFGVNHWNGSTSPSNSSTFITNDLDRHVFSLNTCSGCHGGETQTFFTHIDPANFGVVAGLSGFLTGSRLTTTRQGVDADGDDNNGIMTVNDPANRPSVDNPRQATFQDLTRREADLNGLLEKGCTPPSTIGLAEALFSHPMVEPY